MSSYRPLKMYHGTPYAIHESSRPFLDPALAAMGGDDGDPEEPHIFGTPDMFMASLFALKNPNCCTILKRACSGPVAVYCGPPPGPDDEGCVYEIPREGFTPTRRRNGMPTGSWALVASDMPRVWHDGLEVPGLAVAEPVRRVTMRGLIVDEGLHVCTLTGKLAVGDFLETIRQTVIGPESHTIVSMAFRQGWMEDVTSTYSPRAQAAEVLSAGVIVDP